MKTQAFFFFDGTNKARTLSDSCGLAFIDARVRKTSSPGEAELDKVCPDHDPIYYGYFGYVDTALRQWEANFDPKHPTSGAEFLFFPFNRIIARRSAFHASRRLEWVSWIYWLDTDHWPDFCKEEKLPYDCKDAAIAARAAVSEQPPG